MISLLPWFPFHIKVETETETEGEGEGEGDWHVYSFSKNTSFIFLFLVVSRNSPQIQILDGVHLLAIPSREQLQSLLSYMLDEEEFLSPYGIRSMSKVHEKYPYELELDGKTHRVDYVSGESTTHMFGGNSNWRGPIWLCGECI